VTSLEFLAVESYIEIAEVYVYSFGWDFSLPSLEAQFSLNIVPQNNSCNGTAISSNHSCESLSGRKYFNISGCLPSKCPVP
jgi:hypothetical protein